jgi:hypothetical protein
MIRGRAGASSSAAPGALPSPGPHRPSARPRPLLDVPTTASTLTRPDGIRPPHDQRDEHGHAGPGREQRQAASRRPPGPSAVTSPASPRVLR